MYQLVFAATVEYMINRIFGVCDRLEQRGAAIIYPNTALHLIVLFIFRFHLVSPFNLLHGFDLACLVDYSRRFYLLSI